MTPRQAVVSPLRRALVLGIVAIAAGFASMMFSDLVAGQEQDNELLDRGRTVYTEQCASCHGSEGKGDGSAARFLSPRPRDLTAGDWQYATDGTVEAIATVINDGIDDTAMTPFADVLSDEQIHAVASYVLNVLVPGGGGR